MNDVTNSKFGSMSVDDLLFAAITNEDKDHPKYSQKDVLSALRSRIPNMSVFELLQTFLYTAYSEGFNDVELFSALRAKSGQDIDNNIDRWVLWYLGLRELYDKDMDPGSPWLLPLDPEKDKDKISVSLAYGSFKFRRLRKEGCPVGKKSDSTS
jgi:hypothetical protein